MPEHFRSLIVILILATIFFAFAQRCALISKVAEDFTRRRNIWFAVTLAAFLSQNFWIYTLLAMSLVIYTNRRETNPPALFFFILFALPVAYIQVPGMGVINFFFELSHPRILALIILLPAFFVLRRQSDNPSFGRSVPEKVLAAYLLLTTILYLREFNLTNNLRQVFYLFIDVFLPYFVISRSLKNIQTFRDALLSLVLSFMLLALLAVFESYKSWLLYEPLFDILELKGERGYLPRDGIIRAVATSGVPIALGYLMTVGMGLYLFLQRSIEQKIIRRSGILLLVAGLITPLSRGPWIGATVLLVVFFATGRKPVRHLMIMALASMLILSLVSALPGGKRVINLLPFIGETAQYNVDYRERLISNSMRVIERNPWFGSEDYLSTPEMESMRQGQGIIDIVNSYIQVALATGLMGLGLFVSFFVLTLLGTYRAMRSIPDKDSEYYLLGRTLLSTQLAILVIIFTVSSVTFIPIVYWSVAGMGVAYAQMALKNIVRTK